MVPDRVNFSYQHGGNDQRKHANARPGQIDQNNLPTHHFNRGLADEIGFYFNEMKPVC